jgi:Fe-S cluster biogenesis protein NfuA
MGCLSCRCFSSGIPKEAAMTRESVENVLRRVRPFLRADGGDIELVELDGNCASVRLTGECAHCPSAQFTLNVGIEGALRREIPEFEKLRLL